MNLQGISTLAETPELAISALGAHGFCTILSVYPMRQGLQGMHKKVFGA